MVTRALLFVLASGVAGSTLVGSDTDVGRGTARGVRPAPDTNRRGADAVRSGAAAREVLEEVMAREDVEAGLVTAVGAPGDLCAVGVIPGPAGAFDIRFHIFNIVAERVRYATLDSFLALGGQGLVHESVFAVEGPAGGSTTVLYPDGVSGKGPAVLGFAGFEQLEGVAFNTDPDTYDDPAFGATVGQMNRTVLELAYTDGRRCRGTFSYSGTASVAMIIQTSP